jgi:hypothetical protein
LEVILKSYAGRTVIFGGGLEKERILSEYKRIKNGTEVNVKVNDVDTVAIVDRASKYTYLNIDGVDLSFTGAAVEGAEYSTAPWTSKVAPKKVKVEKVEKVEDEAPAAAEAAAEQVSA